MRNKRHWILCNWAFSGYVAAATAGPDAGDVDDKDSCKKIDNGDHINSKLDKGL